MVLRINMVIVGAERQGGVCRRTWGGGAVSHSHSEFGSSWDVNELGRRECDIASCSVPPRTVPTRRVYTQHIALYQKRITRDVESSTVVCPDNRFPYPARQAELVEPGICLQTRDLQVLHSTSGEFKAPVEVWCYQREVVLVVPHFHRGLELAFDIGRVQGPGGSVVLSAGGSRRI